MLIGIKDIYTDLDMISDRKETKRNRKKPDFYNPVNEIEYRKAELSQLSDLEKEYTSL